jgi:hypothetical protein
MRNVSHKRCTENQTTRSVFNNFYQQLYQLWDNVEKYCRAGRATDDNRVHTQWKLDISGYTYTLTISNTYYFLLQQWLHEHASELYYTHTVCLAVTYVNIATCVHFRNWFILCLQVEWKGNYTGENLHRNIMYQQITFNPETKTEPNRNRVIHGFCMFNQTMENIQKQFCQKDVLTLSIPY